MRKPDAERELRAHAKRGSATLWIDAKWLNALGRERVQEIVQELGYGKLRPHGARTV